MSKIKLNPECWNCGSTVSNDKVCPQCGEHLEDDPETLDWGLYPNNEAGAYDYLDYEAKEREERNKRNERRLNEDY